MSNGNEKSEVEMGKELVGYVMQSGQTLIGHLYSKEGSDDVYMSYPMIMAFVPVQNSKMQMIMEPILKETKTQEMKINESSFLGTCDCNKFITERYNQTVEGLKERLKQRDSKIIQPQAKKPILHGINS